MAIGEGVDLFDCTLPTRMARAGSLLTRHGRRNLRNARFRAEEGPPDPDCACAVCARYPAATLHWLFQEEHALGGRLATYHNLAFLCGLLRDARIAIMEGRYAAFRAAFLDTWVVADPAVGRAQRERWRATQERRRAES
jgi:queuine tRNA-ribosyltransferase